MKNLILTINDDNNYGNRLQNYALSQVLSAYGEVSTIRTRLSNVTGLTPEQLRAQERDRIRKLLSPKEPDHLKERRRVRFRRFTRRYVPDDLATMSAADGLSLRGGGDYDHVVIGSDQVWNCTWLGPDDLRVRLAMDVPAERLLAYAASIGIDQIDPDRWDALRAGWQRIPHLSVREYRAAELIQEISGRDAQVVLDPTLMLTPQQWSRIFRGRLPREPYVLTYFLGAPAEREERIIQDYARAHGLAVRRLNDRRDPKTYLADPARLVELFSGASYVFTDSYHACCFSLVFGKDFKVFSRNGVAINMNSRMETLSRLFGLDDLITADDELPLRDWEQVGERLEQRRTESRAWLESALGIA